MTPLEAWYREFLMQYGEPPNMGPTSNYDYAKALAWGIQPRRSDDGQYHWPSVTPSGEWLKREDHPTRWKEHFSQAYGRDPLGFVLEQMMAEQAEQNGRGLFGGLLGYGR